MKILIIGVNGMLGTELAQEFAEYNPVLWTRDDLDISNFEDIDKKISNSNFEVIINATGYTNVDKAEEEESLATLINGGAVAHLAEVCQKIGATLVHYSTDYVFGGEKKEGYKEDDIPNPQNAYGRSKLVGERAILSIQSFKYYIIRTSWLYGHNGKNFVDTMLRLVKEGKPIKVVDDQFGSPTYARDLAHATKEILVSNPKFGIYHRTNSGQTSWYEFAKEIFLVFAVNADLSACASIEYPTPAKRPKYSTLISTKLPNMRSWQEGLREYKNQY
jgi:dTDP-4-dehydrorhamnose reductase